MMPDMIVQVLQALAGAGEAAGEAAQTAPSAQHEAARAFMDYLFRPETMLDRLGSVLLVVILSLAIWLAVVTTAGRALRAIRKAMTEADDVQLKRLQRALTGVSLVSNVLKWVIIIGGVIAALIALGLGPKLVPVLAGAGVIGLAIGFGAQTLVKDLIAGLIVLLEGQYGVGDFVQIGSVFGQVTGVGVRVTVVRDITGRTYFLPNGSINVVAVYDDPWTEFWADVLIADGSQAEQAAAALTEVAERLAKEHPKVFVVRGEARIYRLGEAASVRLPIASFFEHEWLAKEELVARVMPKLAGAGVELFQGRPIRVYPDYAKLSFAAQGPQEVEEMEKDAGDNAQG